MFDKKYKKALQVIDDEIEFWTMMQDHATEHGWSQDDYTQYANKVENLKEIKSIIQFKIES